MIFSYQSYKGAKYFSRLKLQSIASIFQLFIYLRCSLVLPPHQKNTKKKKKNYLFTCASHWYRKRLDQESCHFVIPWYFININYIRGQNSQNNTFKIYLGYSTLKKKIMSILSLTVVFPKNDFSGIWLNFKWSSVFET